MNITHFPTVTLLITHYNRSKSLERLLSSFSKLGITFGAIIISDDNSKPAHITHITELQKEYNFVLISAQKNSGLGNNLNKGQDAVSTPYTLYVQEDFIPTNKFLPYFNEALLHITNNPLLDIIKFYAYYAYPYLKHYTNSFSYMVYKPWHIDTSKVYQYTDHPHLRRSDFFNKFGRYKEGIKSDKTEYLMCISFIKHKGQALFFNKFDELFKQENSAEEPSTVTRRTWQQSNNILVAVARRIYRMVKYTYDIHT